MFLEQLEAYAVRAVQVLTYNFTWLIGFMCALIACGMGLWLTFSDERHKLLAEYWWQFGIAFAIINVVAIGAYFLQLYLKQRWPHVYLIF